MAQESIERPHYYQRQYLGAQDFQDEQAYQRDMRRRHNLAQHQWGIVTGLELVGDTTGVSVQPGMAVDGFGREIVVFAPYTIPTEAYRGDGQYHSVWLQYAELPITTVQTGYAACDAGNQYNRVAETYQIVVDPRSPYDGIVVNNSKQAPEPALSIPYQELPAIDEQVRWLVPLGQFLWQGKQFLIKTDGRQYSGSLTARIATPSTQLVIQAAPSLSTAQPAASGLTMSVEGELHVKQQLYVERDIQLQGSMLDFSDAAENSIAAQVTPDFSMGRVQQSKGKDVRVQIGTDNKGNNRFVVGAAQTDLLTLADSGDAQLLGSLTVQQDVIVGGNLSIGNQSLFALQKNQAGGTNIQFRLGTGSQGNNFIVGTSSTDLLTITDTGDVAVGGTLKLLYDLSVPGALLFDKEQQLSITTKPTAAGAKDVYVMIGAGKRNNNRFVVGTYQDQLFTISDDGQTQVAGTLTVTGDATIQGALSVQKLIIDTFDIQRDLNISGILTTNGLQVAGSANIQRDVTIMGPLHAQDGLTVDGLLEAHNGLTVSGPLTVQQDVSVSGQMSSKGGASIGGSLTVQQDVNVNGQMNSRGANIGGTLNVQGATTMADSLEVSSRERMGHISYSYTAPDQQRFLVQIGRAKERGPYAADNIYGAPNLWLDAAGVVYLKKGYQTNAMDGAEYFAFDEAVTPGDVVTLSRNGERNVRLARHAHDASVVGVISTDPGFILGGATYADEIDKIRQQRVPVALIGTVPCKVDADIAPIHIGDLLTTSATAGHAQKVLDITQAEGAILGKAMDNLEQGRGVIPIVVMLS